MLAVEKEPIVPKIDRQIHEMMGKCLGRFEWQKRTPVPTTERAADPCLSCGRAWSAHTNVPKYSTDIAAAFKVVEWFRALWQNANPDETQFWVFTDCCEHGWRVDVNWGHHDGDVTLCWVAAPTLPMAICEAALKVSESAKTSIGSLIQGGVQTESP